MLVPLEYQCLTTFQEIVSPRVTHQTGNVVGGSTVTSSDPRHFRDIWVLSGKWLIKCTSSQSSMSHSSFVRRIHGLVGKNWKMRFEFTSSLLIYIARDGENTCATVILGDVYHILSTLVGLCPRFCRVHSQWIGWCFTFFAFLDLFGNDFHSGVVRVEEGTLAFCMCVCSFTHKLKKKIKEDYL